MASPLPTSPRWEAPNRKEPEAAADGAAAAAAADSPEVEGEPSGPPANVTVPAENNMEKFNALVFVAKAHYLDHLFTVGAPGPAVNSLPTRTSTRIQEKKDRLASVTGGG